MATDMSSVAEVAGLVEAVNSKLNWVEVAGYLRMRVN